MTSKEDGFRADFPGQPTVETITYTTEFGMTLPGRVYRASDALGRYSTTVVDYRDVERMHNERAAACRAAKGANQQDGDTCQNDFVLEVAGAMDHAMSHYLKRDGVKVTQYGLYFVEVVSGRLLHLTNPDQSRTNVAVHQHAGRLYIHEATVPRGHARADPVHGVARVGERAGAGDPLSHALHRGLRRLEVPAPHAARSRSGISTASLDQPPRPPR